MSDATVFTRYGLLLLLFLMHVFLSYVLSLICEAVLCLELVFAELGQAHYKYNLLLLLLLPLTIIILNQSITIIMQIKDNSKVKSEAWNLDLLS